MKIIRFCGKERLPGGERLWRKLAKEAGFSGTLKVYGYGAAGDRRVVASQRAYEIGRESKYYGKMLVVGLHSYSEHGSTIEVWLPCSCQTAMDDWLNPNKMVLSIDGQPKWLAPRYEPLFVYAHELGHNMQWQAGLRRAERGATKRGNHLLEKVCGR